MSRSPELMILGASTRAAAASARRAGWLPRCADSFGDRDLHALATSAVFVDLKDVHAFERVVESHRALPWLYTGPLENHQDLVDRILDRHRLLGNSGPVLRAVRDPVRVARLLDRESLAHAEVRLNESGLPRDGSWVVKPIASAGGRSIEPLIAGANPSHERCYFQKFIEGESCSVLFIASAAATRLVGATCQLHGSPAGRFAYRGNIGPIALEPDLSERLDHLGRTLAIGFGLVGLFGVDYILRDGEPWALEVNPRYTASVEVLELAFGRSILADHVDACQSSARSPNASSFERPRRVVGKQVVYATTEITAPDFDFSVYRDEHPFAVPDMADVPWPGTSIARGQPILTILAEAPDVSACVSCLNERAARVQALVGACANAGTKRRG